MSTAVATEPRRRATPQNDYKLSFGHLLRGEWIKFWSVRSTTWTLSIFLVATVGLVCLISLAFINVPSPEEGGPPEGTAGNPLDPLSIAVTLAQLALAVLGALTITSEYSTGMIRSSLTAVPKRLPMLWAKGIILVVSVFAVALVAVALSVGLQWLFFDSEGFSIDVTDPEMVRPLVGTAVYLATIALFSYALGALLRHSAAALATVLGLLLVAPILFGAIPWEPLQLANPFLPGVAGQQFTQTNEQLEATAAFSDVGVDLSAWQGYGVLILWVVLVLGAAAVLLKKRDA
ncbi:ABC transporter permease subunit [Cellulomonas fengjieae]|uniref:ABC transporter permease subunit n=1 Tax=Cellulomonas fengjieae TaxID=2819978 RepID=A0ABS3SM08_9CELL|nr:ABC transporter permease subunit [Cellulomonas fengjieae]MBO3086519.1 ABC transporter permease subunit [Cellulomonas fengjieae]MBO3100515.1 ABC transporter permease subunit [Cellulomonas fengjieae]QVI66622.1 ABC transporter permease subunit [Cellulomonas fengjieae]